MSLLVIITSYFLILHSPLLKHFVKVKISEKNLERYQKELLSCSASSAFNITFKALDQKQ